MGYWPFGKKVLSFGGLRLGVVRQPGVAIAMALLLLLPIAHCTSRLLVSFIRFGKDLPS